MNKIKIKKLNIAVLKKLILIMTLMQSDYYHLIMHMSRKNRGIDKMLMKKLPGRKYKEIFYTVSKLIFCRVNH